MHLRGGDEGADCVLQIYKLNQDAVWAGVKAGSEEERVVLDGLCISAVAVKTVAA